MHTHATDSGSYIPFVVTLRDFAAEDPPSRSVIGYIEHRLETFYSCPSPPGLIERTLLNGDAVVIFDGLDELIDAGRRADVAAVIERFSTEFPLAAVMVTSRLVGYNQARLDETQFTCYRLTGFNPALIADYVRKWFSQEQGITHEEKEHSIEDFLTTTRMVADLCTNPLMLSLMCILYRGEGSIPLNRPEIYEQCASLMFRRWDARRRIHTDLQARAMIEPAIQHLAFWLFTKKAADPILTEQDLISQTTDFLLGRGMEHRQEATAAARELVNFCRGRAWVFSDAGVAARGEALYAFTHRTFMEYFAAAHLASTFDSPAQLARKLAPHIARNEWDVVAQLAIQIKNHTAARGAERIYTALLANRRQSQQGRENTLAFLGAVPSLCSAASTGRP